MEVIEQEVHGLNKRKIPKKGETIENDLNVDIVVPFIKEMCVYFRPKEVCPYNRGNWVIDLLMNDNMMLCLKLPKEMKEDDVMKWLKPLTNKLEAFKKSKMN